MLRNIRLHSVYLFDVCVHKFMFNEITDVIKRNNGSKITHNITKEHIAQFTKADGSSLFKVMALL